MRKITIHKPAYQWTVALLTLILILTSAGPQTAQASSPGTVVAWGWNDSGQSSVPSDLSGVTAIAAGNGHSLALKSDGTVVGWGWNAYGQTNVPSGLSGVTAIAAGNGHSLALQGAPDTTAPTITIATPEDGAAYLLGQAVSADYTCRDEAGGLGLASCSGDVASGDLIDTSSVGAKSFTVSAADNAGNPASLTHHYSVVYNFSGFFQPVDNLPTLNVVKGGAGVAVKFSLGGDQGLGVLAAGFPTSRPVTCDSAAPSDPIEETMVAGNSGLSYDALTDVYAYTWKTNKAWAGTCRQLIVKLVDGTEHTANFKFK